MKNRTELIWKEFHNRILAFVSKRIYEKDDAPDCVQEIFLKIHSGIESLKDENKLESWIFQISRNTISDFNTKKIKEATVPLNNFDDIESSIENRNSELIECLVPFIKQLPQKYSTPLMKYEIEGLSQKEISLAEGISLSGAKSRVQRGRVHLKQALNDCCVFEIDKHGNVLDYTRIQKKEKKS